jgi:hypothetical protein
MEMASTLIHLSKSRLRVSALDYRHKMEMTQGCNLGIGCLMVAHTQWIRKERIVVTQERYCSDRFGKFVGCRHIAVGFHSPAEQDLEMLRDIHYGCLHEYNQRFAHRTVVGSR